MKKLIPALVTLSLACSLAAPGLAWESPRWKYRTFGEYLDFYRAQPDEDTKALVEYIDARLAEGLAESFDADAYFKENLEGDGGPSVNKGNWMGWNDDWHDAQGGYDEEWFRAEMLNRCLTEGYREQKEAEAARQKAALFSDLTGRYPEIYAAFDPYAWFDGYYGSAGAVLENYMTNWNLDEDGFKQEMFMEWAQREQGFFNGYCVTVNGTPIQFQLYQDENAGPAAPKVENERILIPLRAAAEALALTVEWKPETNEVICTNGETTVTFTLDSTQYSGGVLDAAPHAENGVTYLPLRALGEALGCEVTWYQNFATAALTTAN